MESSFQLMIAYDMFHYVKFTADPMSIYFDIGFKLNGKFFSTYDSL